MEVVERQSRKMSALVNQLLNITRMDQGTHKISLERANFSELVEVVCDEAAVASGRDIELEKRHRPRRIRRHGRRPHGPARPEPGRERLQNTAEGGRSVRLASDGQKLTFSVSDNGIGIDKKDLPHIWERFWQADSSRGVDRGSGLGLAMVKQIADAHGGKLGVESSPGEGSTFSYPWIAVTKNSFCSYSFFVLTKRAGGHIMQTVKLRKARFATWLNPSA